MDKDFLEPAITLTAQCHTCNEKVVFGMEKCPHCGITIDQDAVVPSVVNHFLITQAVSSANTIRAFNPAVIFFIVSSLARFIADMPTWLDIAMSVFWLTPLLTIILWNTRHGKWDSVDFDYLFSQKEIKGSFRLWLAANVFNAIVIINDGLIKLD